ncbi:MAG: M24 family metallopeptidase [Candidatus Lokiarchaeota archaeon]|nr:M24 family metallopeptidase [Candidatus Lokiarchaeota archaeon]
MTGKKRIIVMNYFLKRVNKFQEKIREKELDFSIIFNSRHIYYFTGTSQNSILLIPKEDSPTLFVRRDFVRAKKESQIKDLVNIHSTSEVLKSIDGFKENEYNIGIENNFLRVGLFLYLKKYLPTSNFYDVSSIIREMRMIKDDLELEYVRKSAKVNEEVQTVSREYLKEGITELDLAGEIQKVLTENGSTFSYFDGYWGRTPFIIASGENLWARSDFPPVLSGVGSSPAVPHGPSDREIKKDDIVVVDVASVINGYNSDHSRTYYVGKPSDKFKKIYDILLNARNDGIKNMRAGFKIGDFCQKIIHSIPKEYHDYIQGYHQFREGFGHGIGLCLDELPMLVKNNNRRFKENMLIAFEPKIIIPGWGAVNFEDDFIIKKNGPPEQITNSPI